MLPSGYPCCCLPATCGRETIPKRVTPPPSLVSRGGGGAWGHSGGFTGLLRGWVWAGGGREGVGGCEIGPVVGHREQTLCKLEMCKTNRPTQGYDRGHFLKQLATSPSLVACEI